MLKKMATAVYVDDLKTATAFYCDLLGLVAGFESDWIVQLSSPNNAATELMLQPKKHDLVPQDFQKSPIDISSQCEPSAEFIAKYMSG